MRYVVAAIIVMLALVVLVPTAQRLGRGLLAYFRKTEGADVMPLKPVEKKEDEPEK